MYKTIVLHIDDGIYQASRLRAAATLATEWGAHVIGSASTGIVERDYLRSGRGDRNPGDSSHYEKLLNTARERLDRSAEQARRLGIESFETRLLDADAERALLLQSRCADLVVVSQFPSDTDPVHFVTELPEYVALHCPRPVLVVPERYDCARIGGQVVVGWDGSMEAARAVTAALPVLQRASQACLAIINPERQRRIAEETPGRDMALHLARHGVKVELLNESSDLPAADVLLGIVRDVGAGLLVTGAYGHNRYREWVLGGVTRRLLDRCPIPLMMAH